MDDFFLSFYLTIFDSSLDTTLSHTSMRRIRHPASSTQSIILVHTRSDRSHIIQCIFAYIYCLPVCLHWCVHVLCLYLHFVTNQLPPVLHVHHKRIVFVEFCLFSFYNLLFCGVKKCRVTMQMDWHRTATKDYWVFQRNLTTMKLWMKNVLNWLKWFWQQNMW